jgi:hypothetical protein
MLNLRGYHRRLCNDDNDDNNNNGDGLKLLNTTIGNEEIHKYRA